MKKTVFVEPGSSLLRDPLSKNISQLLTDSSRIAIAGVPWDWSVSGRPGARFAPSRIRRHLYGLSTHTPGFKPLECPVTDKGDVKIDPGNAEETKARIRDAATLLFSTYEYTVMLGGDHSITGPILEGLYTATDGARIGLLFLDAHYDLRTVSEGTTSGAWLWETWTRLRDRLVVALAGVADYSNPPYLQGRAVEMGMREIPARSLWRGPEAAYEAIDWLAESGAEVFYISVDMDHIDQAYAPGVNAPTPLGVPPWVSYEILTYAHRRLRVKGIDFAEVNPLVDHGEATSRLAARLVAHAINMHCQAR